MDPMQTPPQQQPGYYQPMYRKTNSKSIAALVLGILAVVVPYLGFIIGIIAIVFSRIASNEIKRTGEDGKGMAVAGLVCGIVGTAIYAVIILIVILSLVLFSTTSDLSILDT
ncbi:DUF4190 domain-containing protein [Paenibacillus selenitireducens]|nr:DUF4190 domain-containing protein [Paenibacillus selenitireducens]